MEDLTQIGFYTLSNNRCRNASVSSDLQRCELIVSSACNFRCPYCRRVGGPDIPFVDAENIVRLWGAQHLKNIRFSGGEPTLYKGLDKLIAIAKEVGCERIAISTNGSASKELYDSLLAAGANDLSISLDACCASDGDILDGGAGKWETVVENIRYLSAKTYVSVGVVLNAGINAEKVNEIITFADSLGVADIRIIPAAQESNKLSNVVVSPDILSRHPILAYRIANLKEGTTVRGLLDSDVSKCGLVHDDMIVNGNYHFPCVIYFREGGRPIGKVGPHMREERAEWYKTHNTKTDPICSKQCLDVCSFYNRKFEQFHSVK
jgi:sulfatase maturation enzyme AslB (radical SAM superfamily)